MRKYRITIAGVALGLLAILANPLLAAETKNCNGVNAIKLLASEDAQAKLMDIIVHYNEPEYLFSNHNIPSLLYNKAGKEEYYLCFQIPSQDFAPLTNQITIELKDDRDLIISGLNVSSATPTLIKLQSTKERSSSIHLIDSALTGNNSGECINVGGNNTNIDRVSVKSCATGILVGAPNVKITNSEITDNGTGVKIASGILGTELLTNKIFDNVEGIVFADGQPNELVFFDGDEQSFAPAEAGEDGLIDYGDKPVYMNVVLNGASTSDKLVKVEYFWSNEKGHALEPIPCTREGTSEQKGPITAKANQLASTPIKCNIPPNYREKNIVSILTDPRYGTTGFSQQFKTSAGDVVTFVSSPFDMPTSGMDGAGTSGEEVEVGSGGGEVVGGAMSAGGPKGCGGQLAPGGAARTVDVAMSLWWIILAGAVMGGMRLASPRVRQHH